ncbi:MAG: tetratricopeptide repeat protein, partial [Armatimonadetes bacterium]|nr:tetratricopeptide repeat protein [Armatimonadota bacterium]
DPRAAFASWQEAPDGCSGSGAFLRRAARILIEHGEPVAAKEVLEAWVGLEPGNSEAHLRMGITISAIRPQDALDTLRFARELSREGSGLATALIETIEASALVGEPAYSLAQVGQALAREEEWQLAKVAFQNALALQPDYPDALAYLGLTLDKTGSDGSQQLQTAAASAPEAAFPNLLLGIHWRSVGNLRKAQDALETAAGLDPKDPVIMVELAATYLEMGQIEAAEA